MRRPLFMMCLCLVVIAAMWLKLKNSSGEWGEQEFASLGEELTITGRVYSKDTNSFTIDSINLVQLSNVANSRQIIPNKTKLICENKDDFPFVRIGSTVMVKGTFAEFSVATNDGEFDSKSYYEGKNICGKLTDVVLCGESQKYSVLQEALHNLRQYFKKRINQVFPEKEASLLVAMLLGDKEDLDGNTKELYQRNGIIHILSISGLHITLIGMGIYKLLRRLGLKIGVAAVCGGVFLCLYGVMTGMSLSACRAIGMYLIRMMAEIVGRSYDMLTALGVMAAFLVGNNPNNLCNAGFLLSFSSILGIGIMYPVLLVDESLPLEERAKKEKYEPVAWKRILGDIGKTVGSGLKKAFFSGVSITLFNLPIQLWFYYEIPVYSVLLNLLVLPFVSAVMVTGLVTMLVPGTGMIGTVAYVILKGYELVCECFEKLPFHTWNPGKPQVWQMVMYYFFLLLVIAWVCGENGLCCTIRRFLGKYRVLGVGKVVVLALAVGVFALHPSAKDRITFLDVGQGDCILLETREGEAYLFDCGSGNRKQIGEYVLLPFLKYHGIRRIDAVFVSHFDEDHCNGIRELLSWREKEGIAIGDLVVPEVVERMLEEGVSTLLPGQVSLQQAEYTLLPGRVSLPQAVSHAIGGFGDVNMSITYMSAGEIYPSTGASILCLHPPQGYEEDGNASSMCFYVNVSGEESVDNLIGAFFSGEDLPDVGYSILLTGDAEGEGEEGLLKEIVKHNIRNVDVIKVAHHGSRNATGEALLEQVAPRMAVISCGRNNRYGHPHPEVIQRLEETGCEIFSTATSGQVTVVFDKGVEIRNGC